VLQSVASAHGSSDQSVPAAGQQQLGHHHHHVSAPLAPTLDGSGSVTAQAEAAPAAATMHPAVPRGIGGGDHHMAGV
jgi:hypothetical protein